MHDASFQVFSQFLRHLSVLVTHTISHGKEVLNTLYPKGTARDMSFLLEPVYWFRCLMLESLAVMGVDSEDSRERRSPWGVLNFLKAKSRAKPRSVDKLMIWVPVPCAIDVIKALAATSSNTTTSYRVEKVNPGSLSGRRFSYYAVNVKNKVLALNQMQEHFPSTGHSFRAGAVPPAVAQYFVRTVGVKTEVKLPLYSPGLEEFGGDSPPCSLLPDNWVVAGAQGKRIYEEVMAMDYSQFMDSSQETFGKHENCPVLIQEVSHHGFKELIRPLLVCFHEDPCSLWNGPLLSGWKVCHAKQISAVDTFLLKLVRRLSRRQ